MELIVTNVYITAWLSFLSLHYASVLAFYGAIKIFYDQQSEPKQHDVVCNQSQRK